jgi:hypothetical protein
MRWLLPLALVCLAGLLHLSQAASNNPHGAEMDDNDFAEFEEFDDDDVAEDPSTKDTNRDQARRQEPKVVMSPEAELNEAENAEEEDAIVEDEDDEEFMHLSDDEEFEGFDPDASPQTGKGGSEKPPDLKFTKVPLHLRTNWDSFYMEMLMLAGLGVYFLNFLAGKSKNNRLAQAWLAAHKELLESNFSIVGDDGTSPDPTSAGLIKESENLYSLWCSGRVCCEGMLVTLKLLKRQDLVSTISRMFRPVSDQIIMKVELDDSELDTFVFCLANKKVCTKMQKDLNDLNWFCQEKRRVDSFNLPASFQLLSEIPEATAAVLDPQVVKCINKYEEMVEFIHVSDQYCGPRNPDDPPATMPETSKVMIFCFNTPEKGKCSPQDMEKMTDLMKMVFHCVDKVKRIRISGQSKLKADRNRQRVSESFSKASHAQRAETAQARKEDKLRAEKDRIMKEEDPEKQKRLEDKYAKKDAKKKKQTKMKMMKVKAA